MSADSPTPPAERPCSLSRPALARRVRPIARDHLPASGRTIVAARHSHENTAAPCRAPVTHAYAVVTFYTGGQSRIEQNGQWTLRRGDVLLVPAGEPHCMLETRGSEYWALAFCVPCVPGDDAASLLEPFERVRDGASAVVHIPAARQAFLKGLFRELEDVGPTPRGRTDTLDAVQRSLLTLILAEITRVDGPHAALRPARGGVVVDALRFIERNCLRRLTVREIASAVGRTPTYVTAALTRATGRSAGQWVVSGRMAEARRRLLHSDEMVDVIAERVGYADATHFIRTFRREHGATPAVWRAAQADATRFT